MNITVRDFTRISSRARQVPDLHSLLHLG